MQSNPGLIWRMDRQNDRVMSLGFSLFMLKFSFSVEMDYFMREWWLEGCHDSRMVGYTTWPFIVVRLLGPFVISMILVQPCSFLL